MESGGENLSLILIKPELKAKAESFKIDVIGKTEDKVVDEIIDFRVNQYYPDRLCEYITGLRLDDPELPDRLAEDQKIIRAKYGLPDRETRFIASGDHEKYLRELARENGVEVKPKSECGKFFEENQIAGAVYLNKERAIGVDLDRSDEKKYFGSLGSLEHETIHSLQDKYYPQMPVELQEYEAYVACFNTEYLRENPSAIETNFTFAIGGSVNNYYHRESEESGVELRPLWNNPEYFLKNVDGISEEQIEKYRTKHQDDQVKPEDKKEVV